MKVILKVIKGLVTAFLVIVLLMVVFQKITKNKITVGNFYVFQVVSESMLPDYKVGDVIVVKKADSSSLKIGDDVTYQGHESDVTGLIVTHRIVKTREDNGKHYFVTKGIANEAEDPEISEDDIYGKVLYHTVIFSFVGRLMSNIVVYYLLFVAVGVGFAYEFITGFIIKKDDDEDEEDIKEDSNEK